MSRIIVRTAMLCLAIIGVAGLASTIARAMGNDLSGMEEARPKLDFAYSIMLLIPAFWAISSFKRSSWRIVGMLAVSVVAIVIIRFLAPDTMDDPGRDDSKIILKLVPVAVLVAMLLVIHVYERKRNKDIAKGYVMRFGLAFKKCSDGYDVVSEDGCAMRNTPYGVEFYDALGNPTAFKAADIAAKWKIDKGESE